MNEGPKVCFLHSTLIGARSVWIPSRRISAGDLRTLFQSSIGHDNVNLAGVRGTAWLSPDLKDPFHHESRHSQLEVIQRPPPHNHVNGERLAIGFSVSERYVDGDLSQVQHLHAVSLDLACLITVFTPSWRPCERPPLPNGRGSVLFGLLSQRLRSPSIRNSSV